MRWLILTYSGSACRPDPLRQRSLKNRCLHRIPPFCSVIFVPAGFTNFAFLHFFSFSSADIRPPVNSDSSLFRPSAAVFRTYILSKSQKKQEPPQTIQSVPKAWTCTHSAYMSLLLFLSVLFVGFLMMLCHTFFV